MKSIFTKTRIFVALMLYAIAILPFVSCQKVEDNEEKPSPLAKDWVAVKIGDSTPSNPMVYSFTQSGQFEAGVILDEIMLKQLQQLFSDLTVSEEGQKMLASFAVGDLLVQFAGSYTVSFDESGTAGTITMVMDPQKCSGEVNEENSVESGDFHDLQEDRMMIVGYSIDSEGNRTGIDIEMKTASSLGIEIGKHHILKTLTDSVTWKEEF